MIPDAPPKPTALLVANDADLREVIGELFRQEGYVTTAVGSLHEARIALKTSPSVLVLDIAFDGALETTFLHELADRTDPLPTILCLGAPQATPEDLRYRLLTVPRPFDVGILFRMLTEARNPA